jgi:hypothetical protein
MGVVRGSGDYDGINAFQFFNDDLFIAGNANSVSDTVDHELLLGPKAITSGTDAFLARYSLPCGCVTVPVSSFTFSSGLFTFTGSTPADSVTWDFGDGSKGKGLAVTHSYSGIGKYKVCATVWTADCGYKTFCDSIEISVAIADPLPAHIRIYPNPAADHLDIEGLLPGTGIRLYSMVGQELFAALSPGPAYRVSLNGLPGGLYLLRLNSTDGRVWTTKFLKQ